MKISRKMLFPSYAFVPLIFLLLFDFFVFYGSRVLDCGGMPVCMWTVLDDRIPLLPGFALIYVLAYVQWAAGLWLIVRENRETCYRFFLADAIAEGIALVCFLFLPTYMIRPEVPGTGLCADLLRGIYRIDAPDHLFPSLHCVGSWICMRSAFCLKKIPRWVRPVSVIFTLLVCASTVFLKQHVFLDIPAGIAAAEAGLFLSGLASKRMNDRMETENDRFL